jgi:hypothetical protein
LLVGAGVILHRSLLLSPSPYRNDEPISKRE